MMLCVQDVTRVCKYVDVGEIIINFMVVQDIQNAMEQENTYMN